MIEADEPPPPPSTQRLLCPLRSSRTGLMASIVATSAVIAVAVILSLLAVRPSSLRKPPSDTPVVLGVPPPAAADQPSSPVDQQVDSSPTVAVNSPASDFVNNPVDIESPDNAPRDAAPDDRSRASTSPADGLAAAPQRPESRQDVTIRCGDRCEILEMTSKNVFEEANGPRSNPNPCRSEALNAAEGPATTAPASSSALHDGDQESSSTFFQVCNNVEGSSSSFSKISETGSAQESLSPPCASNSQELNTDKAPGHHNSHSQERTIDTEPSLEPPVSVSEEFDVLEAPSSCSLASEADNGVVIQELPSNPQFPPSEKSDGADKSSSSPVSASGHRDCIENLSDPPQSRVEGGGPTISEAPAVTETPSSKSSLPKSSVTSLDDASSFGGVPSFFELDQAFENAASHVPVAPPEPYSKPRRSGLTFGQMVELAQKGELNNQYYDQGKPTFGGKPSGFNLWHRYQDPYGLPRYKSNDWSQLSFADWQEMRPVLKASSFDDLEKPSLAKPIIPNFYLSNPSESISGFVFPADTYRVSSGQFRDDPSSRRRPSDLFSLALAAPGLLYDVVPLGADPAHFEARFVPNDYVFSNEPRSQIIDASRISVDSRESFETALQSVDDHDASPRVPVPSFEDTWHDLHRLSLDSRDSFVTGTQSVEDNYDDAPRHSFGDSDQDSQAESEDEVESDQCSCDGSAQDSADDALAEIIKVDFHSQDASDQPESCSPILESLNENVTIPSELISGQSVVIINELSGLSINSSSPSETPVIATPSLQEDEAAETISSPSAFEPNAVSDAGLIESSSNDELCPDCIHALGDQSLVTPQADDCSSTLSLQEVDLPAEAVFTDVSPEDDVDLPPSASEHIETIDHLEDLTQDPVDHTDASTEPTVSSSASSDGNSALRDLDSVDSLVIGSRTDQSMPSSSTSHEPDQRAGSSQDLDINYVIMPGLTAKKLCDRLDRILDQVRLVKQKHFRNYYVIPHIADVKELFQLCSSVYWAFPPKFEESLRLIADQFFQGLLEFHKSLAKYKHETENPKGPPEFEGQAAVRKRIRKSNFVEKYWWFKTLLDSQPRYFFWGPVPANVPLLDIRKHQPPQLNSKVSVPEILPEFQLYSGLLSGSELVNDPYWTQ